MYKICIFDMDGTIVNTLDSISFFGNKALEALGLVPIETVYYRQFVGSGASTLMRRMLKHNGIKETPQIFADLRAEYDKLYESNPLHLVEPYDGVTALLSELKESGIKLAILSNKPDNMTRYIADKLFPNTFDLVWGQREDMPIKPDAKAVLQILGHFGIGASNAVYIGDSDVDMQTGINAGVATFGVTWGFRDREVLEAYKVNGYADTVEELKSYILSDIQ